PKTQPRETAMTTCTRLSTVAMFFCLLWQVCGAPVPLAKEGKPAAAIVTGEAAGELTRYATTELQSYLEKLSGVRLPIVTDNQLASRPATEPILLVGSTEQNPLLREIAANGGLSTSALKKEGFVIRTLIWKEERPVVAVAGADEAGALYGSYE